jgi:hypothetical protein
MADEINLGRFEGDRIVVHFGGDFSGIDAYTFANSLIGFADTARAVNATIDPGQEIEIILEEFGPGSFRARLRRIRRDHGGLLSRGVEAVFWGILATLIYENVIKSDAHVRVVIQTDEVRLHHGSETIVVPRHLYEACENAKKNPAVQRGLERTFRPLNENKNVTEFGLTTRIDDPKPIVRIPRSQFELFTAPDAVTQVSPTERVRKETARLYILKAWLKHAKRKWSFEWNGVPISAPITDTDFLDRLQRREHLLGAGDALDVEITFKQFFDDELGVHVNEPDSYVVTKVIRPVPREGH